ncbi:MAG: type II toxin-antitoxin system PemK/MazF family toxin [Bacteroidales bacterium]|jgi:mRNA interferase MazF|nr:type II toxin-antitoxin system PemK/MazF family toxin [Bacteroidales bacterium]
MKQAEIWYADLNQVKGNEQAGYRPVVIISGNALNTYMKIVIACPLTTKIKNYKGNLVLKPTKQNGLDQTSEVLVFHIRSISKNRLVKRIGNISDAELRQVKMGLNEMLRY